MKKNIYIMVLILLTINVDATNFTQTWDTDFYTSTNISSKGGNQNLANIVGSASGTYNGTHTRIQGAFIVTVLNGTDWTSELIAPYLNKSTMYLMVPPTTGIYKENSPSSPTGDGFAYIDPVSKSYKLNESEVYVGTGYIGIFFDQYYAGEWITDADPYYEFVLGNPLTAESNTGSIASQGEYKFNGSVTQVSQTSTGQNTYYITNYLNASWDTGVETPYTSPPYFSSFNINATTVYEGELINFEATITEGTSPLDNYYIQFSGTTLGLDHAHNGTNNITIDTLGLSGIYTVVGFVNDSLNAYDDTLEYNVTILSGSTTTTTSTTTTLGGCIGLCIENESFFNYNVTLNKGSTSIENDSFQFFAWYCSNPQYYSKNIEDKQIFCDRLITGFFGENGKYEIDEKSINHSEIQIQAYYNHISGVKSAIKLLDLEVYDDGVITETLYIEEISYQYCFAFFDSITGYTIENVSYIFKDSGYNIINTSALNIGIQCFNKSMPKPITFYLSGLKTGYEGFSDEPINYVYSNYAEIYMNANNEILYNDSDETYERVILDLNVSLPDGNPYATQYIDYTCYLGSTEIKDGHVVTDAYGDLHITNIIKGASCQIKVDTQNTYLTYYITVQMTYNRTIAITLQDNTNENTKILRINTYQDNPIYEGNIILEDVHLKLVGGNKEFFGNTQGGTYIFTGLDKISYTLTATKDGFQSKIESIPENINEADIILKKVDSKDCEISGIAYIKDRDTQEIMEYINPIIEIFKGTSLESTVTANAINGVYNMDVECGTSLTVKADYKGSIQTYQVSIPTGEGTTVNLDIPYLSSDVESSDLISWYWESMAVLIPIFFIISFMFILLGLQRVGQAFGK